MFLHALRLIVLAAMLLASPAATVVAQSPPDPLLIGYYEIPPYLELVDGKLTGVLADIWYEIAEKAQIPFVPVSLPPARLVKTLADGEVDVSLLPINFPDFVGRVLSSQHPVEHIVLEAYSFPPTPMISKVQDLIGRSVVLQQGFGYGGLINFLRAPENRITIVASVPLAENGLRMLEAGRGDAFLHYRPSINQLRRRLDLQGMQAGVLSAVPIHVVLSKSTPNAAALMARIDAVIQPSAFQP